MELAYDGTNYHGWQTQPNAPTVQETIENALSTIMRSPIAIVGAGRTDTGVHASHYIAHFDVEEGGGIANGDLLQLVWRLNSLLPQDIAIHTIYNVSETQHARFSATSRTYHYYIHTRKDPFLRCRSLYMPAPLDIEAMNEAAASLLGEHDFTSFSKLHTDVKTNVCLVSEAQWRAAEDGHSLTFIISANRFLRNMVRAIVGTLLQVGRGALSVDDFRAVIKAQDRSRAGTSAPAHALFLHNVKY